MTGSTTSTLTPAAARRGGSPAVSSLRKMWWHSRRSGPRGVAQRVVRLAYRRLGADALDFPLLPEDVVHSSQVRLPPAPPLPQTRPLRIGWITTPPARGSGGHTTMFRMVAALTAAGHDCRILLYDRYGGELGRHRTVIREAWPFVDVPVQPLDSLHSDLDACFATSWDTAHVLASRRPAVHPFYFIQDYEPFFFPKGPLYELARDTYRFGFTNIALGQMVQRHLMADVGVDASVVPFSCDNQTYFLTNPHARSGVVFYARPGVPRRGYETAVLALAEFHRRHPDQPIHVYGGRGRLRLDFPVVDHGVVTPAQLNGIYNRSIAGLALSFTNISLVAEEMLAAGCTPVVNDDVDARDDMPSPAVAWCPATPDGVAEALSSTVARWTPEHSRRAAASIREDGWREAGRALTYLVESRVHAASRKD